MIASLGAGSLNFDTRPWVVYSPTGTRYIRRAPIGMPKIPQETLKCVVFLYTTKDDALNHRDPQGTGFLVGVLSRINQNIRHAHFYVLTNKHVSVSPKGQSDPAPIVCLNLLNGDPDPIELDPSIDWQFEPNGDDVAIAPIELDLDRHTAAVIPTAMFADENWVAANQIGFGDDVFMLGLFLDESGIGTSMPKARFGNISAMPSKHTQIAQENGSNRPSIIIDMHSRGGHSGSPVFVYRTLGANLDHANTSNVIQNEKVLFKFFGLHWGQFPEILELRSGEEVTGWSGMTCAIPAWRLEGVLNWPEIKKRRAEREAKQAADSSIVNAARGESVPRASGENPTHREDFNSLVGAAARKRLQGD